MNPPSDSLPADDLPALPFHVENGSPENLQTDQNLGLTAVKNCIETLKFANMHDQALAVLLSAQPCLTKQKEFTRMAVDFFSETDMPVEDPPHVARADSGGPGQLNLKKIPSGENSRHVTSKHLNDEITQTLLGINSQMIALKNEIAANYVNHHHDIAMIQQMVGDSAETIRMEIKDNGHGVEIVENMNTMPHNGLGRWCSMRRTE
jgi:hypothetical protein